MSRPRGKGVQRKLANVAKEILQPFGFHCEVDFTRRGGHQQLKISYEGKQVASLELPSSPRNEGDALSIMRQRARRLARDFQPA